MNTSPKEEKMVSVSVASERAEAIGGVLIAFFAALMAIAQLVNSNLEEEMMIAHNRVNSYSSWYQSKSVKESLMESELATLESLKLTVDDTKKVLFDEKIAQTKRAIEKYGAEKTEILLGSSEVGEENWAQDLDGKLGVIMGVKEWEARAEKMDISTQKFDLAMLFFQIALVLGAVCIIIYDNPRLQKTFIGLMVSCGVLGICFSIYGYALSL
ncbi:protein of unknown function [Spirosomataceae bacterium TFI 002]|nr:protein of unknown function [Spirosomataceae bacterium TFI 002]